ncbi:hypothetical protein R3P38DRAFT_2957394 [Favolaschia claudopus]|uniref:Uncharacterized protein n=1 Tax=Favolaschia claudopus TaxID=2862362 RepID=A0AAW0BBF9_9AGAR
MDADRKSTVSSFYGARKGSMDALNQDYPMDPLGGRPSNAGYNRGSFFPAAREEPLKGGRDEEEGDNGWDVYADFNNAGPRYSSAFGKQDTGYQSLGGGGTAKLVEDTSSGPVEMVTVPALGPEWKKSEMHDMTKASKREKKAERRKQLLQDWRRGKSGGKWCNRRAVVFICFGLIAIIAVVLGICIPRVPSFALSNSTPLANATGDWRNAVPTEFSRFPANFSFPAFADLQLNTDSNYLPLSFKHLRAKVFDLDTGFLIGTGDLGHKTVPAKSFPEIQLPLNFTYIATNDSDTTWLNWYNACQSKSRVAGGQRPGVRFRLVLTMDIIGLPGSHSAATQVNNANCPIELPSNSV